MARVVELTGINHKTLHHWDMIGFLAPSIAPSHGTGTRRVYNFADVVTLTVIRLLRNAGVGLAHLTPVVHLLQRHADWQESGTPEFLVLGYGGAWLELRGNLEAIPGTHDASFVFQVVALRRLVSDLRQKLASLKEGCS